MMSADLLQTASRHQSPCLASAEQHGVAIEFAARNGKAGKRIEGIVLDDADKASRARHAPHLIDEVGPLGRRDMVEHANRSHDIETVVVEGKASAVEGAVLAAGIVGARLLDTLR